MRLILALIPLVLTAQPQTAIPPNQLRWGEPGEISRLRLVAVSLAGLVNVELGPGLRLEPAGTGVRIVATAAAVRAERLTRNENGHYPCPADSTERVYRNGLYQLPGTDYRLEPFGVIPLYPWDPGDLVVRETRDAVTTATASPTVAPVAQVRNWDQVSVRGLTQERRPGTRVGLAQLTEGQWLLAPAVFQPPGCRWRLDGGVSCI